MKDLWIGVGIVLVVVLVVGIICSACIFFAKVWEFINNPLALRSDSQIEIRTNTPVELYNCEVHTNPNYKEPSGENK